MTNKFNLTINPTGFYYKKRVITLPAISAVAPGTEVRIESPADVLIMSDWPVDVILGESAVVYPSQTELYLKGIVGKLRLRKIGNYPGRLVLLYCTAQDRAEVKRENMENRVYMQDSRIGFVWPGAAASVNINTLALPRGGAAEAAYIRSIFLRRYDHATGGPLGTIEHIQFIEAETGAGLTIFYHAWDDPADRVHTVRPFPIRIASAGTFTVYGSTEAGDSDLDLIIEVVDL